MTCPAHSSTKQNLDAVHGWGWRGNPPPPQGGQRRDRRRGRGKRGHGGMSVRTREERPKPWNLLRDHSSSSRVPREPRMGAVPQKDHHGITARNSSQPDLRGRGRWRWRSSPEPRVTALDTGLGGARGWAGTSTCGARPADPWGGAGSPVSQAALPGGWGVGGYSSPASLIIQLES